jgi:N-acetylglucosaminyldiphosphoundecaprenol N-acetyl-beta-D-mannosaminyltransferase
MADKFLSLKSPKNKFLRIIISFGQGLFVGFSTFFARNWLTRDLEIIKGRELAYRLVTIANKMGWRVFFLGGRASEAQKAAYRLKLNYKKVKIESFGGPELDNDAEPISEVNRLILFDAIVKINNFKPHLLFVAFGNPKQEKWIRNNLRKLKIGGAMAVGGTFRYLAGESPLPPKLVERFGLEWFWRLITEPKRIGRMFRAVIVFPWKVFISKIA